MTDLRLNQTVIDKFGKLQKKKITSSLKNKICYRSEILFTPLCTLPSVFFCFFGNVSYSNQVILNLRHLSWEDCTKRLASSHYKTVGTKPMLLKLTDFWPKYRQNRQVTNVPELKIQGVKRLLSQIIHDKTKLRHQKTFLQPVCHRRLEYSLPESICIIRSRSSRSCYPLISGIFGKVLLGK